MQKVGWRVKLSRRTWLKDEDEDGTMDEAASEPPDPRDRLEAVSRFHAPDEEAESREVSAEIQRALQRLGPRPARILAATFGLGGPAIGSSEIGASENVSRSRIQQIVQGSLAKLRQARNNWRLKAALTGVEPLRKKPAPKGRNIWRLPALEEKKPRKPLVLCKGAGRHVRKQDLDLQEHPWLRGPSMDRRRGNYFSIGICPWCDQVMSYFVGTGRWCRHAPS